MTTDTVSVVNGASIQHGPFNDRVYLMSMGKSDPETMVHTLRFLANVGCSSKIITKVPASAKETFCAAGYQVEAHIPRMFEGTTDGFFLAQYLNPARAAVENAPEQEEVLAAALAGGQNGVSRDLPKEYSLTVASPEDTDELAALYEEVFATYPFPIHRPDFLNDTMEEGTVYFLIRKKGNLVAASSAETDPVGKCVEMTDFATKPAFRGRGLSSLLLAAMEEAMRQEGYYTAYTIARALVLPVNRLFAGAGYQFGGTLFNNTNIGGSFESMNVWSKPL